MQSPLCHKCSIEMAEGIVLDHDEGLVRESTWHEGTPPVKTMFGFKISGLGYKPDNESVYKIVAYRCPECGLLNLYAR